MFKWLGNLTDSNEREIARLEPTVNKINDLEEAYEGLSDEELKAKTAEFKARLAEATRDERAAMEKLRGEFNEAQKCYLEVPGFDEKEQYSAQCKSLQDEMDARDKDVRKKENQVLADLLVEAFAAVREAAKRTIHQRHFDVQLMGGIVLHQGKIAEMKTGEGKTLVATLPLYLNALTGRGVHLVTVNDYLARRDPYWMGPVFHALGLRVASIFPMQAQDNPLPALLYDPAYDSGKQSDPWRHFKPIKRAEAYRADITYGTSAEFGFDYLRDNMALDLSQYVQRDLNYAIVDEVDNLLIDEARTPLIISAPDVESSQRYAVFARLVQSLQKGSDYETKEKERSVEPTDEGFAHIEGLLKREGLLKGESLYDPHNADLMRHLRNALSAKEFYRRDREYVVKDGEILIVDEFTGRLMLGRRYSEGLHQAIEAKEHVKVQQETKTYATVTIQNYFRMYAKLAGMTGTAVTEAEEFHKIYKLEVVVIPTNKELIRKDEGDLIYKDEDAKFKALVRHVEEVHKTGQPILIGTTSIEKNERLAEMLNRRGIRHNVLNAKRHEQEASIIAEAGLPGAVTVATNMAGRGVDIILGGRPPVLGFEQDVEDVVYQQAQAALEKLPPEEKEARAKELQQAKEELAKLRHRLHEQLNEHLALTRAWQEAETGTPASAELTQRLEQNNRAVKELEKQIHQGLKRFDAYVENKALLCPSCGIDAWDEWRRRWMQVRELGGLHVIGSERHEARRIDNQLRGRAGRQGDPGASRFFVALDDDIMRRFGGERIQAVMNWAGMDENTPIENKLISRSIENAQVKVEGYHFDIRKHLVDYDDVVNKQREVIYGERRKVLTGADLKSNILAMVAQEIEEAVDEHVAGRPEEEQDYEALVKHVSGMFPLTAEVTAETLRQMTADEDKETLVKLAHDRYEQKEKDLTPQMMRVLERLVMLRVIDSLWVEHLTAIDYLRQGIGMQAVAQQDPLVAYKRQASEMFQELLDAIRHEVVGMIYKVSLVKQPVPAQAAPLSATHPAQTPAAPPRRAVEAPPLSSPMSKVVGTPGKSTPAPTGVKKVGRNEPCPCGSGKKYKHCHGQ